MMNRFIHSKKLLCSTALLAFLSLNTNCLAQGYPYEDTPTENSATNEQSSDAPKETNSKVTEKTTGLLVDRPPFKRKYHALFRMGLKAGGNFTLFQNPSAGVPSATDTFTGLGFEGNLSLGWDLPYQPIFLELESGYRGVLISSDTEPLHIIPLTFGMHYRYRFGQSSLWKPGLKSSLELRFTKDVSTGSTRYSANPAIAFSSLVEFGNFLIEPLITVARIQSQYRTQASENKRPLPRHKP